MNTVFINNVFLLFPSSQRFYYTKEFFWNFWIELFELNSRSEWRKNKKNAFECKGFGRGQKRSRQKAFTPVGVGRRKRRKFLNWMYIFERTWNTRKHDKIRNMNSNFFKERQDFTFKQNTSKLRLNFSPNVKFPENNFFFGHFSIH